MERFHAPARLMVVSDLDFTMVDHDDPANTWLLRFNALWESKYQHDSILVFASGRPPILYDQLIKEKPLLTPDITIMSVGTEITYGDTMVPDRDWEEAMSENWDRGIVMEETSRFPQLTLQAETQQTPYKVSFKVRREDAEGVMQPLSERLNERGRSVKLIYSAGQDIDVLPQGAGKGQALAYLLNNLNFQGRLPQNILVCGDSGNDVELFSIPDVYGVVVGNAHEELRNWYRENAEDNPKVYLAKESCAGGIIEAIGHFGLGPTSVCWWYNLSYWLFRPWSFFRKWCFKDRR